MADSTKAAGKAAKGAMASFDQLNVLQDNSAGSGGSSGTDPGAVSGGGGLIPGSGLAEETSTGFDTLIGTIQSFWERFTQLMQPSITAWTDAWKQIKSTAVAVWPEIQAAASGLWTNALQPLLAYLAGTFVPGVVNAFSTAFAPIVGDVISTRIQILANYFVWICGIWTDAINNLLRPALDTVLQIWQGLMAGVQEAWSTYGQPVMDGVVQAFLNLQEISSTLYYTVIEPIVSQAIKLIQKLWDEHLQRLWTDLLLFIGSIGDCLLSFWNNILAPIINWLIATFGPVFTDVFNSVAGLVETAVGMMADAIDIALVVFRGLLDFLSAVFRGDWDAAWEAIADTVLAVWDRIKSGIKSAINGVIGFINGMLQAIANALNRVIDAVNTLSFTVPDWVPEIGGSTFGFQVAHISAPQIPYLAQGAVIPPNREFLAVLGDQTSGTNVEAPLSTIQEAVAAVMEDMLGGQMAGFEAVVAVLREILSAIYGIQIGDEIIGRAAQRYAAKRAIIEGVT